MLSTACVIGATFGRAVADDEPYQPVHLPACEVFELADGRKVCGYTDIADWRAVLRVDAEVTQLRALVATDVVQLGAAREQVALLEHALAVRESGLDACQRSLAGERVALKERDRLYQRERARPRWGTWLSWGAATVAGGVALGLVLNR